MFHSGQHWVKSTVLIYSVKAMSVGQCHILEVLRTSAAALKARVFFVFFFLIAFKCQNIPTSGLFDFKNVILRKTIIQNTGDPPPPLSYCSCKCLTKLFANSAKKKKEKKKDRRTATLSCQRCFCHRMSQKATSQSLDLLYNDVFI